MALPAKTNTNFFVPFLTVTYGEDTRDEVYRRINVFMPADPQTRTTYCTASYDEVNAILAFGENNPQRCPVDALLRLYQTHLSCLSPETEDFLCRYEQQAVFATFILTDFLPLLERTTTNALFTVLFRRSQDRALFDMDQQGATVPVPPSALLAGYGATHFFANLFADFDNNRVGTTDMTDTDTFRALSRELESLLATNAAERDELRAFVQGNVQLFADHVDFLRDHGAAYALQVALPEEWATVEELLARNTPNDGLTPRTQNLYTRRLGNKRPSVIDAEEFDAGDLGEIAETLSSARVVVFAFEEGRLVMERQNGGFGLARLEDVDGRLEQRSEETLSIPMAFDGDCNVYDMPGIGVGDPDAPYLFLYSIDGNVSLSIDGGDPIVLTRVHFA